MTFALTEHYRRHIQRLSARERRALGVALVVLLSATLALAVEALFTERTRLDRQVPALKHSLASMEQDAAELARLRGRPAVQATPDTTVIIASARARGISADIRQTGNHRFRLEGQNTLSELLPWLADLHAEYGMRIIEMQFNTAPANRYTLVLGPGNSAQ